LTRSLIIFGQGAIRAHPWLLQEMNALQNPDEQQALAEFDRASAGHARHLLRTLGRAWLWNWSGAALAPAPRGSANRTAFRRLSRYASALAFTSEVALLTLGGSLKRRESISARLGDVLSELYFLSAVLKRFRDDGERGGDAPVVQWCCETGFARIESALAGVIDNFPVRWLAWTVRAITLPFGVRRRGPGDAMTHACAEMLMQRGPVRDRLTPGVYPGHHDDAIQRLEHAFVLVHEVASLRRKVRDAGFAEDPVGAVDAGLISEEELAQLLAADDAVLAVIAVDSFTQEELLEFAPIRRRHKPSQSATPQSV